MDAIAELLKGNSNYHALLKELESEQYTNVNLLIHLLEKILKREQNKVRNAVIAKLLEDYPIEQREFLDKVVYSGDDQDCFPFVSGKNIRQHIMTMNHFR